MKTLYKRKFFCLLLSIFLLAALSVSALAAEPGSAFLVGSDVRANANVEGILFAAGYRVEQTSTSEYAFLAGETVRFDGTAVNDIFAAGYDVTINGEVARDVYAAGNSVRVAGMVGASCMSRAAACRSAVRSAATCTLTPADRDHAQRRHRRHAALQQLRHRLRRAGGLRARGGV